MDKGTGSRNKKLSVGGKWLGLTTISDSTNLPLGALKEATNVVSDVGGMLRKREGFETFQDVKENIKMYDEFLLYPSKTKQKFATSSFHFYNVTKNIGDSFSMEGETSFELVPNNVDLEIKGDPDSIKFTAEGLGRELYSDNTGEIKATKHYRAFPNWLDSNKSYINTWNESITAHGKIYNDLLLEHNFIRIDDDINRYELQYGKIHHEVEVTYIVRKSDNKTFATIVGGKNDIMLIGATYQSGIVFFIVANFEYNVPFIQIYASVKSREATLITEGQHLTFIIIDGFLKNNKIRFFYDIYFNSSSIDINSKGILLCDFSNPDPPLTIKSISRFFELKQGPYYNDIEILQTSTGPFQLAIQKPLVKVLPANELALHPNKNVWDFITNQTDWDMNRKDLLLPKNGESFFIIVDNKPNDQLPFSYRLGFFWDETSTNQDTLQSFSLWDDNMWDDETEKFEKLIFEKYKKPLSFDDSTKEELALRINNQYFSFPLGTNLWDGNFHKVSVPANIFRTQNVLKFTFVNDIYHYSKFSLKASFDLPKNVSDVSSVISDFSTFNASSKPVLMNFKILEKNNEKYIAIRTFDPIFSNFFDNQKNDYFEVHSLNKPIPDPNDPSKTIDNFVSFKEVYSYTFNNNFLIIHTDVDILVFAFFEDEDGDIFLYYSTLNHFAKPISTQELFDIGHNIIDNNKQRDTNIFNSTKEYLRSIKLLNNDTSFSTDKIFYIDGDWSVANETLIKSPEYSFTWTLYDESGKDVTGTIKRDEKTFIVPRANILSNQTYSIYCVVKHNNNTLTDYFGNAKLITTFKLSNQQTTDIDNIYEEIKHCKYSAFLNEKLVLYGNGQRKIYTSMFKDPFYFYANNIVIADSFGKKEEIISISNFKDIFIIFTENTMMSMSGDGNYAAESPWSILGLDSTHGSPYHNGVCPIENTLAFQSLDGIYLIEQLSVADKRVQLSKVSMNLNDLSLPFVDDISELDERLIDNVLMIAMENRLLVYYDKGNISENYFLVYDYSNTEFNNGVWFKWKTELHPVFMKEINKLLYLCNETKIVRKFPKLNQHIYDANFSKNPNYYTDLGNEYELEITTRDSTFGEVDQYKRVKNITLVTTNAEVGTADLHITTETDSQPDLDYTTNSIDWKKPMLGSFMMNKQMTVYRPYDNLHSKSFLKSKNGRLLSISIKEKSKLPFEIKELAIDILESSAKNKKIR